MVIDQEPPTEEPPMPMMDEPPTQAPPISGATEGYAPETLNLVSRLMVGEDVKIVDECIRDYDRDWESLQTWREIRDRIVRLFLGMMPPPEDGEMRTQIHYPIIATAVQRLHARVYDQQFPSNGEYWGVRPTDALDLPRSVRLSKHMNWATLHRIPEYVPNHDVLIQQWLLYGSAFSYMYWDPVENRPCHEACRTEDIVISYTENDTDPSMSKVGRITRRLRKYRHELMALSDSGYYSNVDRIWDPTTLAEKSGNNAGGMDDQQDRPIRETMDRAEGKEKPQDDPGAPRELLEQHRWLKLPGETRDRAVIVTIDKNSRTLLCLKIREDEDPEDRARYNREKQANQAAYAAAMEQYQASIAAYLAGQTTLPAPQPGMPGQTPIPTPGEQTMTAPPMPGMTTSTMPGPPPEMPQPPPDPEQPKMVPINFFTHYVCIPNPEGFYGFGVGSMLEGHNMVADTIASQLVDAGTLANTSTFLFSRQAKLSRGEFKIKPGMGTECDLSPQDLANGIKMIEWAPPNAALGQFVKDQKEEAQELSGASDILSGEVGGSNETATTTQIRISQAMAAVGIQNKRYTRARTVEGQKLARLFSVHLNDTEYFTVVDPYKAMPPSKEEIGRMDYLEDVDITITADPRMASQPQRFQEALQAWNLVNSSPMLAQNPALMMAVAKNLFVSMDRPELVAALMTPPPPPPPGMPGPPGPNQGPPQEGPPQKNGPPKPKPQPMPSAVPNAGPTPPNGEQMGQNV